MITQIGEIVEDAPVITPNTTNNTVNNLLLKHTNCQGIVVVENDYPIALVTRTNFYQKLGTLYGYNLYMGRSVELLMDKNLLVVDFCESIFEVSELAMNRSEEQLYDYVVVTKNKQYYGIVSIRKLLTTLAKAQSTIASYMNPLTGLPGNKIINEKLENVLEQGNYTVLYIDLDNFKAYNDVYGFAKGDQVIQATASLLKENIDESVEFIGHIGGDDFLAILYKSEFQTVCERIISDFNRIILEFYEQEHLMQSFVTTENRHGLKENIPLISISIAAISNSIQPYESVEEIVSHATTIKKRCKQVNESCFIVNSCIG